MHEFCGFRITVSTITVKQWLETLFYWHHIHHNVSAGIVILLNQSDWQAWSVILSVLVMRIIDFSYRRRISLKVYTHSHMRTHTHRFSTIKCELPGLVPVSIVSTLNLLDCDRPLKGCQDFLNLLQRCTLSDWVPWVCLSVWMCIYFLWHSLAPASHDRIRCRRTNIYKQSNVQDQPYQVVAVSPLQFLVWK